MKLLSTARVMAVRAHEGQSRKGLDEPYVAHPIRVAAMAAEAGLAPEAVAAALLHDVVEDTALTLAHLEAAGFPPRTVALVAVLSKWWPDDLPGQDPARYAEYKAQYYAGIVQDPDALVLKILDRTDNLRDMRRTLPGLRKWAANYLRKTKREFAPLAVACPRVSVVERFVEAARELEAALG